jgi:hypothetical protein
MRKHSGGVLRTIFGSSNRVGCRTGALTAYDRCGGFSSRCFAHFPMEEWRKQLNGVFQRHWHLVCLWIGIQIKGMPVDDDRVCRCVVSRNPARQKDVPSCVLEDVYANHTMSGGGCERHSVDYGIRKSVAFRVEIS